MGLPRYQRATPKKSEVYITVPELIEVLTLYHILTGRSTFIRSTGCNCLRLLTKQVVLDIYDFSILGISTDPLVPSIYADIQSQDLTRSSKDEILRLLIEGFEQEWKLDISYLNL